MEVTARKVEALRAQAKELVRAKQWAKAADVLRELLQIYPNNPEILTQLSYMESLSGHYRAAKNYALSAGKFASPDAEVFEDQLARLRTFNEGEILCRMIERLGPPSGIPIPVLNAAAAQLSYLNLQKHALKLLDESKRADPDFPPTLVSRAQVLTYFGRFEEAEKDVSRALKRAPEIATAHWTLARLRKQSPESNHVAEIRAQLAGSGKSPDDVAALASALHKELDDVGDIDGAWAALEQACHAKRGTVSFRSEDSRKLFDSLISLPIGPMSASDNAMSSNATKIPIFIVGMHRSGTTLLEQLLDGSPDVRGVGELYDFTSAMRYATDHHCQAVIDQGIVDRAIDVDFSEVGRYYLEGMNWRLGEEPYFTDKLPSNFLNAGFICRALPQARILHMVRDPVETCFSNLRELFSKANPYSYDQSELADYFLQYRRLMAHWHAAYPGRILDVDYAELTRDPEAVMRKVAAFYGIDYIDAMADPRSSTRAVATASAVQVRDRVVRREVPKWAPYARHLEPLIAVLRQGGVEVPGLPG